MKILIYSLLFTLAGFSASPAVPAVFAGEGHDAGYRWAEEHDITDTGYSNGNSESFNEGVREYAEEQQEENGEDSE